MPLALFALIFHGASANQTAFFGYELIDYIEETSSASHQTPQSPSQLADINSFTAPNYQIVGRGGQDNSVDPNLVQENYLVAYNPTEENYIDSLGLERSQILEYTIQEGDLISFIASDFGVSVNSIIWANNLSSPDRLSIGQTIKIPPVSGVIHTVKKGDTVASLAKKYGVEESKIVEFNALPKDGQLTLGDELVVPDGQMSRSSSTGTTVATATKPFSYLPNLGDYFMLPTNGFNWGRIHGRNGVDIANQCGTPIYAAADGTVTVADAVGWNGGFGQYIKISHDNGTETLYAHARKLLVKTGENVSRGTLIANMGTTGRSTGCHLHFEVHGAKNPLTKY